MRRAPAHERCCSELRCMTGKKFVGGDNHGIGMILRHSRKCRLYFVIRADIKSVNVHPQGTGTRSHVF